MPAKNSNAKGPAKQPAVKAQDTKPAEKKCRALQLGHHGCDCPQCLEGQRAP